MKPSPGLEVTALWLRALVCLQRTQGQFPAPTLCNSGSGHPRPFLTSKGNQAYTWFTYIQAGKRAIHIKLYFFFFIHCWKSPISAYLKVTHEHGLLTTTQVSNFKKAFMSLTRIMLSRSQGLSLLKWPSQRALASDVSFLPFTVRSSRLSVH